MRSIVAVVFCALFLFGCAEEPGILEILLHNPEVLSDHDITMVVRVNTEEVLRATEGKPQFSVELEPGVVIIGVDFVQKGKVIAYYGPKIVKITSGRQTFVDLNLTTQGLVP